MVLKHALALTLILALGACAAPPPPAPTVTTYAPNKCKDAKVSLEDPRCR